MLRGKRGSDLTSTSAPKLDAKKEYGADTVNALNDSVNEDGGVNSYKPPNITRIGYKRQLTDKFSADKNRIEQPLSSQ